MTKTQKLFEREFYKENLLVEDFEGILSEFEKGDQCILDFSKTKNFDPSSGPFRLLLEEMIVKSSQMVVMGPECFEQLVNGIESKKFHFILKSFSTPQLAIEDNWEDLVFENSKEFFNFYFTLHQPKAEPVKAYAVAAIEIEDDQKIYQFGLVMCKNMLQLAIEKVLLIPADIDIGESKELAPEILNMICGHLRAKLKQIRFDLRMGVPHSVDSEIIFPPTEGKYWIFQDYDCQMGLYLKEVQHVCI